MLGKVNKYVVKHAAIDNINVVPNRPQGLVFAVIFFIQAYKPAGGFSGLDIQYPGVAGTVAQDVDPAGHNFRGTTKKYIQGHQPGPGLGLTPGIITAKMAA